ncbi:pectate lyase [Allocatelliglobosispora scoriae]|uniref:Pectate lyase n=1 Tax=Allocatelliglobosispora scoriae TaxID=643052 RepID=A0A841C2M8_9ACTN|nr:pectate lyase [Allocatelliglobosispora scoriae]MBB5873559.1 pectate lyase [Allocatelliglobosispora scoriae]
MSPRRRSRTGWAAIGAAALACALAATMSLAAAASAATLYSDDFEDGDSAGWSTSGGSWSVGTDGSRVLQQSGTSSDARARAGSATWTDYTVSVRVKPTAFNGSNRFVAVLARAQSATSYYYLALRSANVVELKKLVGGASTTLASTSVPVSTGTWVTLSLQVAGSSLRGTVNGGSVLTATDTQFATGQVGVATYYAGAAFDDVTVTDAVVGSPSPSTPNSPSPSTSASPPPQPPAGQADGFASVTALGLNGTTGGVGGPTVTVTTTAGLLAAIDTTGPLVIRVQGTINITSKQGVRPNKTIVGVGTTAVVNGGGFDFYRSSNVIVRNIRFTNAEDDAINVGQNSHHIWLDHNEFVNPVDGSIDIVRGAEYVTVSWNWFRGTDKSMLIGHSDGAAAEDVGHLKVSIHHNYFDGSVQRHPRVRFGEPVHVYNNYFRANTLYGVASTMNAGVLVEGNYFSGVPFPCYSAGGYADSGPGRLVQRGNIFVGSGPCEVSGSVTEPSGFYAYTLDNPAILPTTVPAGAGVGRI